MKEWKALSKGRSALMIDGARRVGKSWIAKEFAEQEYESYLLIDFSKVSKTVKNYFFNYLNNLDVFFMYLMGEYNVELKDAQVNEEVGEIKVFFKNHLIKTVKLFTMNKIEKLINEDTQSIEQILWEEKLNEN